MVMMLTCRVVGAMLSSRQIVRAGYRLACIARRPVAPCVVAAGRPATCRLSGSALRVVIERGRFATKLKWLLFSIGGLMGLTWWECGWAFSRAMERGESVWEDLTQPKCKDDLPTGLHTKAQEEVAAFLRDRGEHRPMLVYGPHHVGKSTLIMDAWLSVNEKPTQRCDVQRTQQTANANASEDSPRSARDDAEDVMIHLDLKARDPTVLHERIADFYCAMLYFTFRKRRRRMYLRPHELVILGDRLFHINSIPHAGDAFPQSLGSLGLLLSRLVRGTLRTVASTGEPTSHGDWSDDLGFLREALNLLDRKCAKRQAKKPNRQHTLWITDLQNLTFVDLPPGHAEASEKEEARRHKRLIKQLSNIVRLLTDRHRHGYAGSACAFRLLIEESDFLAAVSLVHMDDAYFRPLLAIVDELAPHLRTRTGDWYVAQQFIKTRGPSVTAEDILSHIRLKHEQLLARALHDVRMLPNSCEEPPSFLEFLFDPSAARHIHARRHDPLINDCLHLLNSMSESSNSTEQMDTVNFFDNAAALALVRAGVCMYDHEQAALKLQRPATGQALPIDVPRSSRVLWPFY